MAQALSESLEDYLEAIYHVVLAKQAARATDIRDRMGVNRSSVTGALRALAERGLVNYAPYDLVTLTDSGQATAERVVRRHRVLRDFLVKVLAVDDEIAETAACGMEHHIGKVVVERLGCLAEFLESGAKTNREDWLTKFQAFCRKREAAGDADEEPGASGPAGGRHRHG